MWFTKPTANPANTRPGFHPEGTQSKKTKFGTGESGDRSQPARLVKPTLARFRIEKVGEKNENICGRITKRYTGR